MTGRAAIRSFITRTFFVEDFADGDSFMQSGIIDSMGMMELVAFLESTYSLKLADTELVPENLDSVDAICRFLERKQVQAA